jgi:hypothetical protein
VFELRMNDLEGSGVVRFTGFGGIQAVDLILGLPKESKHPARVSPGTIWLSRFWY